MSENVIALDGPAYVGKSQIAQALALQTRYTYINTGHMYRSVAKAASEQNVDFANETRLIEIARALQFDFTDAKTSVNGEDWTELLNDKSYVVGASKVAGLALIRDVLTAKQRELAQTQTIIMEGRDIGSVVFPKAKVKFFVTASFAVRVKRMKKLLLEKNPADQTPLDTLAQDLAEIDERDEKRAVAPLKQADDAIVYDNSASPDALKDAEVLYYYLKHPERMSRHLEYLEYADGKYC